jgi:2-polyprenyl-3-methyl-5-hydroxy-6-metoxy-1,4-benzoquinol methylase
MDQPSTSPEVYARCLRDLSRVNAFTFTHRATLSWIAKVTHTVPKDQPVSILDVACGHGDLLRAIGAWAKRTGRDLRLEGIDLNPGSAAVAQAAIPPGMSILYRSGDVFQFSPDPRPDLIVTSQFTHHLTDAQLVQFLRWLDAHAAMGWCIVDLHRHALAYYGFPVLARIAGWHRIVRQDGQISVARAFRKSDWTQALSKANVSADIKWIFPFRYRVAHLT